MGILERITALVLGCITCEYSSVHILNSFLPFVKGTPQYPSGMKRGTWECNNIFILLLYERGINILPLCGR